MKRLALSILCVCGWASTNLIADPVSVNPQPRMESMGYAGLAGRGDRDSAMLNPAGLNDVDHTEVQYLPLLVEAPYDYSMVRHFLDYNDVRTRKGASETDKKSAFNAFITDLAAEAPGARFNFYPSFTKKNFHLGFLLDVTVDPRLRLGGLTANEFSDAGTANGTMGLIGGYAHSFFDQKLQAGITLKPIYRGVFTQHSEQTIHDILLGLNSGDSIVDEIVGAPKFRTRGFGFGVDLGVKYQLPFFEMLRPAIGVTYQDIGDTRFFTDKEVPSNIPQSISAGLAIHPDWGFMLNTVAFDIRNINSKEEFVNKINAGLESILFKMIAIRGGFAQGYWTTGLGFSWRFFQSDLYITAREAGHYAHIQPIRTFGLRISGCF